MSAFGGKADVRELPSECPLIAKSGHWDGGQKVKFSQIQVCKRGNGFHRWHQSSGEVVEQGLGVLQVGGVEAFCEPVVDRREKVAGLRPLALALPDDLA